MHKLVFPEVVRRVLYQLNESDEQPPGVRSVHNESFQQHPSDLLLDGFSVGFGKERQQCTAEIVGVAVWIAQLIGDGIEEQVTTWNIEHSLTGIVIIWTLTHSPSVSKSTTKCWNMSMWAV